VWPPVRTRSPQACSGVAYAIFAAQENIYQQARSNETESVNRKLLTWVLAAVLILAVCGTILIIVLPQPSEPFTELYLLGASGKASDYPTNLTVGQTANVTVGVVNQENANVNYTLVATLTNKTITNESFSLANNQKWQDSISFTATTRGSGQKLAFDLYKSGDANVYRSVYLFVTVT
jgi:uncharacterized membrane protein